jgi:peptide-methionine (S)-S-oxide reductase
VRRLTAAVAAALALGCGRADAERSPAAAEPAPADVPAALATFAGGCFWCMEPPFDALEGVLSTTSGYAGGHVERPSYEQVSAGGTGHLEVVQVAYDATRVSYEKLLEVFWRNVDPTDAGGQFCDRGAQYRTAIFVHDPAQRAAAEKSARELEASARFQAPLATEILPAGAFWPAEAYHQDFYRENPIRYRYYRAGCGRDRRLAEVWGRAREH